MSSCVDHQIDHAERVVVLETKVEALEETNKEILASLKTINNQLTKYHGFIGGIAFIVSGVGVLWTFGKDWFLNHWN
jgi:hypothetical protein